MWFVCVEVQFVLEGDVVDFEYYVVDFVGQCIVLVIDVVVVVVVGLGVFDQVQFVIDGDILVVECFEDVYLGVWQCFVDLVEVVGIEFQWVIGGDF